MSEPLIITEGKPPTTATGEIGCVMLVKANGISEDSQLFSFLVGIYDNDPVVYGWEKDTALALFPANNVDLLLKRGYARLMTASEAWAYNAKLEASTKKETKP